MDDDRVEYAEIERKTNDPGHPTTALVTKSLPARNIKRQSTKGIIRLKLCVCMYVHVRERWS